MDKFGLLGIVDFGSIVGFPVKVVSFVLSHLLGYHKLVLWDGMDGLVIVCSVSTA